MHQQLNVETKSLINSSISLNSGTLRPEFIPRIRREKTIAPTYTDINNIYHPRIYNDGIPMNLTKKETTYMDMAPINSRTDIRDVRQSQPYIPQLNISTANNPYFQKFDITQDPRNVTRELQSSVYEERTGSRKEEKALFYRGFQHAWVNEDDLKRETEERLRGGEVMRPMQSSFVSRIDNSLGQKDSINAGASHW
jgi:hypothetical protein